MADKNMEHNYKKKMRDEKVQEWNQVYKEFASDGGSESQIRNVKGGSFLEKKKERKARQCSLIKTWPGRKGFWFNAFFK